MIFKDIHIENFRGIKSLDIKDLGRVNLFLGKNNSGKTSVLEAVFLITGISNPQLVFTIGSLRDLIHSEADDFKFIFYGLDYMNGPNFEANLYNREIRTLHIQPTFKAISNSIGAKGAEGIKPSISTATNASPSAEGVIFDFSIKPYHSPKNSQKATLLFQNGQLSYTPPKNYIEKLFGVFLTTSSNKSKSELPSRLEKIIVEKRKNDVVEVLKIIDPSIKDIIIGTNSMIYLDIGLASFIPTNIQGEGLNRLLSIITTIYFNKNGLVFVDEIENGFHYKIFRSIWKAVIKAAHLFNVQLFITTHNYELLEELKSALDDSQMETERNTVSTYSLIRAQDNTIDAIRYDYPQFENAIQQDLEIR